MSDISTGQNRPVPDGGWRLVQRHWLAVLKDHQYCAVCGQIATWSWVKENTNDRSVASIFVCDDDKDKLRPHVNGDDEMNVVFQSTRSTTGANSIETWKLKCSTAHHLVCGICGDNTRWGREVRGKRLCDRHWTLRNRIQALLGLHFSENSGW